MWQQPWWARTQSSSVWYRRNCRCCDGGGCCGNFRSMFREEEAMRTGPVADGDDGDSAGDSHDSTKQTSMAQQLCEKKRVKCV